MKRIWTILGSLVMAWMLLVNHQHMAPPRPGDLDSIRGEVRSVEEIAGRQRLKNGHILLRVVSPDGVTREIVSYDRSLLTRVVVGQSAEFGIHHGSGGNELWTVKTAEGRTSLTYEDTLAVRHAELREGQRNIVLFVAVAAVILALRAYLKRSA